MTDCSFSELSRWLRNTWPNKQLAAKRSCLDTQTPTALWLKAGYTGGITVHFQSNFILLFHISEADIVLFTPFFLTALKDKISVSELLLPKLNQLFKILNLLENTPSQSWQHTRFFWDHEKLEKLACGWSAAQKGEKGFRQAEKKNVHSIFFGATTDGFTTNWRRLLGKYRLKTGSWWSVWLDRRCVEQQVRRDCLMVRVQVSHAQPETNHWQTEGDKHTTSNKGKSTKLCRS